MMRGNRDHWLRSFAFLAIWVIFGGVVIAGWLTQLGPSADRGSLPFLDVLDDEPATGGGAAGNEIGSTTPNAGSDPFDTTNPFAPIGGTPVPSSGSATSSGGGTTASTSGTKGLGTAPAPIKPAPLKLTDCPADSNASVAHPFGCQLASYIGNLYRWALVIGAGLAVMMIMWAGYTYVISAGDPEAVRVAKDYLWGALLGLALLILTYTIFSVLRVGVPGQTSSSSTAQGTATSNQGGSSNQGGVSGNGTSSPTPSNNSQPAADTSSIAGTYRVTITSLTKRGADCPAELAHGGVGSVTLAAASPGPTTLELQAFGKSATIPGTLTGSTFEGKIDVRGQPMTVQASFATSGTTTSVTASYSNIVNFFGERGCAFDATMSGTKSS